MASSILEQVQAILSVKQDIADVLEAHGTTVGSRFSDYASAIQKVDLTDDTGFIVNRGSSFDVTWPECVSCFVMPSQVLTVDASLPMFVTLSSNDIYGSLKAYLPVPALHLNRVTEIYGSYCFAKTQGLSEVDGPEVRTIGYGAFQHCSALSSLSLPQCQTIGVNAFAYCYALSEVDGPEVRTIDGGAFQDCSALSSLSLPQCQTLGAYAFEFCYALSEVDGPEVRTIGYGAFQHCSALSSLSLPQCQTLDAHAFEFCYALSSVSLPKVESIGSYAFFMGDFEGGSETGFVLDLTGVSKVPTVGKELHSSGDAYDTKFCILVPASLYSMFLSADGWSVYSSNITSSSPAAY